MKKFLKNEWNEMHLLLKEVPAILLALTYIAIIAMNILANKTIVETNWIALDGGFIVSWVTFLTMDMITKRFGPKASIQISILGLILNLLVCLVFFIVSIIPTKTDYSSFNQIIGGTWFIVLSSSIAFIASVFINTFLNYSIGKLFKNSNKKKTEFVVRSYVSTMIGQFFDNFIFASLTFMVFAPIFWDGFHWTFIQCLTCSITGAVFELLLEVIFSPIGYKVCVKWEKEGIGEKYLNYMKEKSSC